MPPVSLSCTGQCTNGDAGVVSNVIAASSDAPAHVRGSYPRCTVGGRKSRRRNRFKYARSLYRKASKKFKKSARRRTRHRSRGKSRRRRTRASHAYGVSRWPVFRNSPLTRHRGGDGKQFSQCSSYGLKMQPVGAPTRTLWGAEAPSPNSSDGGRLATTYIAASQSSRGTRLNNQ